MDLFSENGQSGFSQMLSERWEEFVNCKVRLLREAPFLRQVLSRSQAPRVLDAAMGIGCETILLNQWGVEVIGNEIDDGLHSIAIGRANELHQHIHTTQVDWRKLAGEFGADSFDIVLLLGNSFCMLLNAQDRERVARDLRAICRPGGTLVVDQRNFDKILQKDHARHGSPPRIEGGVMYCGGSVYAAPYLMADGNLRFSFRKSSDHNEIGYLDGYPFRGDALPSLFLKAGFHLMETRYDFACDHDDDAEFLTYVFA